jgi:hypothetical protein
MVRGGKKTYGPSCSTASQVMRKRTLIGENRKEKSGISGEGSGAREDDPLKVRPQRRSRARCCGASSSGNGRPTKVTVSAPAGNVALLSLTGLGCGVK